VQQEVSQTANSDKLNYNTNGVLNLPLVDGRLALRIGVQQGYDAGYINLVSPNNGQLVNRDSNTNQWLVGKAALKWQIDDAWSVTPAVFYQDMKTGDTDTLTLSPFTNPISGTTLTLGGLTAAKWLREPGDDRLTVPSVTVDGDLGFATLVAVASHYQRIFDRVQDGTTVNVPYLVSLYPTGSAVANGLAALDSAVDLRTAQEQSSFEVRLASRPYEAGTTLPISWVAGAYGSRDATQVWDNEPVFGINTLFDNLGLNINSPSAFGGTSFPGAWPADDSSYYSHRYYYTRKEALFGELTYYFEPHLHAIFGVREEWATEGFNRQGNYYYTGCGGPTTCPLEANPPSADFSAFTPHFNLTWDINDSALAYANVAKGYRLGSFNRPVPLYGTPSCNPSDSVTERSPAVRTLSRLPTSRTRCGVTRSAARPRSSITGCRSTLLCTTRGGVIRSKISCWSSVTTTSRPMSETCRLMEVSSRSRVGSRII
jgi:iron complex outermembrane receptor protein